MSDTTDAGFDTPDAYDGVSTSTDSGMPGKNDPMRPEARRGRYYLPNPESGKSKSWQRVTNFVKLTEDTYHLELWKQRNVAKGLALMLSDPSSHGFGAGARIVETLAHVAELDVKADKERLNRIVEKTFELAEAYKMADEGTALHSSTERVDYQSGRTDGVPERHIARMRMYLGALAAYGLKVAPGMIERVTVSPRFEVAGKFDRVFQLMDGSYVIGDLKTGDSLDLSMPSIAAQLDCYRDGINTVGVFDGQRYEQPFKVRTDFGLVIHLPSTREEVSVIKVDLATGRKINKANLTVRETRRIKAKNVATTLSPVTFTSPDEGDAYWLEQMNAVHTYESLVDVVQAARASLSYNDRLAAQARVIAAGLRDEDFRP
jgi:hypothetical protein